MPILPMIECEAYSLTVIEPDFVYLQEKYTSLKNLFLYLLTIAKVTPWMAVSMSCSDAFHLIFKRELELLLQNAGV